MKGFLKCNRRQNLQMLETVGRDQFCFEKRLICRKRKFLFSTIACIASCVCLLLTSILQIILNARVQRKCKIEVDHKRSKVCN